MFIRECPCNLQNAWHRNGWGAQAPRVPFFAPSRKTRAHRNQSSVHATSARTMRAPQPTKRSSHGLLQNARRVRSPEILSVLSVVHHTIYKIVTLSLAGVPRSLEQTGVLGTARLSRFASFSPREKVPAGRMRGKGARQTKVRSIAETPHTNCCLSVFIHG